MVYEIKLLMCLHHNKHLVNADQVNSHRLFSESHEMQKTPKWAIFNTEESGNYNFHSRPT
jgi:hypothetical protein